MTAPTLLLVQRGSEYREISLSQTVVVIGRVEDNEIVLDDPLVSRRHARVEFSDNQYFLVDLGSSNGTRLNGTELEPRVPAVIKENDRIELGSYTLTPLSRSAERAGVKDLKTPVITAADAGATFIGKPYMLVITVSGLIRELPLNKPVMMLGRDKENDIVIEDSTVSRRHAELKRSTEGYVITDLGSSNGLVFNGQRVSNKPLLPGDVIWIGQNVSLVYRVLGQAPAAMPPAAVTPTPVMATGQLSIKGQTMVTLGRQPDNNVVLDNPTVSKYHARIWRQDSDGSYVIQDLNSTNGTFVNGQRVTQPRILNAGDSVFIGSFKLAFTPEAIQSRDESQNLSIDALHLNQFVSKELNLLRDISLSVEAHEFVAVVGVSGAGKSTLLAALNGFKPATSGAVMVNGNSLYDNFDAYRTQLGYVPQEDIIHRELTVHEGLSYAAKLRLPADTTPQAREQRVMEVINILNLTERKDLQVGKLSGGQRKRVSIGVELLTKPGLFFLDEATSGLDPGTEGDLMRLLRKLSDQGHTILLITHATKNVMLCDQVAFLAKGGYLAYYGPPEEALRFFGVKEFDDIYRKLEQESTPQEWALRYQQSPAFARYIVERLNRKYGRDVKPAAVTTLRASNIAAGRRVSDFSQFITLSTRNLNILFRDRAALILMLLVPIFVGLLDFLRWKKSMFDIATGDPHIAITNLFFAVVTGSLCGSISTMREIVKESDIYKRERMVSIQILPYVFSKFWIAIVLSLYQALVFLITKKLAGGWPIGFEQTLQVYITLWLVTLSGMSLGLLISAVSPNQNVAPLLLMAILVPQFIFGGIIPGTLKEKIPNAISQVITSRWAFESMVTISRMGRNVSLDPCFALPAEQRDKLSDQEKQERCACLGTNVFKQSGFPGVMSYWDPIVNEPEPKQPQKPADPPPRPAEPAKPADTSLGDPPSPPSPPASPFGNSPIAMLQYQASMNSWQNQMERWKRDMEAYQEKSKEQKKYMDELKEWQKKMEGYQKDMEGYQKRVDEFQKQMETWQNVYRNWKEGRARAIGGAEAVVKTFYDGYGHTFNVNLASHWSKIGIIILVVLGLIILIQKLKDPV